MRKIRVLLLSGGGYHDFDRCGKIVEDFLGASGHFRVTHTTDRNAISADSLNRFDCLVLYTQGDGLTKKQVVSLEAWVRKGKGLLGIHCASDSFTKHRAYLDLLGSRFVDHGPVHTFQVEPTAEDHPITRRIPPFKIEDELYLLEGDSSRWTTLLSSNWRGKKQPLLYTREEGKGRIVYLALGHDVAAMSHAVFQKLVVRSLRWLDGWKEPDPIRCGVIGYGGAFDMGKTHAEMMRATAGLEFVAACDVDKTRMAVAQEDFPDIRTFTSVKRMLQTEDLDLVTLVTPHHTHGPLAVQCANAGKHVITEKPMCITVKEADAMIRAGKKNGVMVSVFHNRRWDGDYVVLKRLIAEGAIGEVFQIDCFSGGYEHPGWWWRSDKKISGGILYDWGAHFIDWILNLVPSPLESVAGHFQKRVWQAVTNEDHALAILRFKNGAVATFEQSSLAAAPKDRWRVLGTQGAITLRDWHCEYWSLTSYRSGQPVTSQVPFEKDHWGAYYRNVADHLLAGEELEVKPEQARKTIAVIEGAEKAWKMKKALLLPLPRY